MKIQVGDIFCKVLDVKYNLDAVAVIRNVCRARPANYQYMPMFKKKMWDGYISLMPSLAEFPTGLLSDVIYALNLRHYHYTLVYGEDYNIDVKIDENTLVGITLRDYQVEAANVMLEAKRGVAKMATNSGKTEIMAAIIKAADVESVVLVHRKELMYQTAERFFNRGILRVGMIGDAIWDPAKVTVAMIQTLGVDTAARCKQFHDNKLLFIDECHTIAGKQATDVYTAIPGAYRYGVSGTPLKNDLLSDLKLLAATGPVLYELSNEYMTETGYSATPHIALQTIEDTSDEAWELDYHSAYDKFIVNNDIRNKFIADFAKSIDGTVLILVNIIKHGEILQKLTGGTFVSGRDSVEYRKMAIDIMRDGRGIFIASPIFDEGIDVPGVNAIALAGGGQSQTRLLQRIGRGLRHKRGINELSILDFIDDTNKHLLEHSSARIAVYDREGFDTTVR